MSGYLRNLGRRIAPFALPVIAAASTLFVMIGSLLLAPLILAGFWLNDYLMREERVVAGWISLGFTGIFDGPMW